MLAYHRRFITTGGLAFVFVLFAFWISPVWGAFSFQNGQDAALVLGQVDFTTKTRGVAQDEMNGPGAIAVDPVSKKIFVAEIWNNRVLRFASFADLNNGAQAEAVLGQANFTSNNSGTSQSAMSSPMGLAVDSNGRLWVADTENRRVLRFDNAASKANGANADGVLGQANFTSRSSALNASGMFNPEGVAVDTNGRLWVADSAHHRVLRFDNAASKANGANADGVLGQTAFNANVNTLLNRPVDVVTDSSGRVWVVNNYSGTVKRFDNPASSTFVSTANGTLGTGIGGTGANSFTFPNGAAIDSQGSLWVTDTFSHRVLRFDNAASKADEADADVVLGVPDFTTFPIQDSPQSFISPYGVAVDPSGVVLVADTLNDRVLAFTNQTISFQPSNKLLGDGPITLDASASSGLAVSLTSLTPSICSVSGSSATLKAVGTCTIRAEQAGNGTSITAAASVQRSFEITQGPKLIWIDIGQGPSLVIGQSNLMSGSEGLADDRFWKAQDVAVDPNTLKVFVADRVNNRVLRFASYIDLSNGAKAEAVFGQPDFTTGTNNISRNGMHQPFGVRVDASGSLWVADTSNNRLLRFDNAATKASGADADGVLGQANFTTNSSSANKNGLSSPTDMVATPDGSLWVVDSANNRVLRFDNAASKPNGGDADAVLGQANFTSTSAAGGQNRMNRPFGIELAGDNLWVSDFNNNRVLRFDNVANKADGANADGVLGQTDFTGTSAGLSQNRMNAPYGLAIDQNNTLWVAEYNNHRVLRFDAVGSKPNGANADGALGQAEYTTNTPGIGYMGLRTPAGIGLDPSGALLVADSDNHRVLVYLNQWVYFDTPSDKYLGNPAFALNASSNANLPFTLSSNTPSICTVNGINVSMLAVGDCTIKAQSAGGDAFHTNALSFQSTFAVKAAPEITYAPSAITYGTALSASHFNASASIPGSFSYSPALGTVLAAGTHTFEATFTATDTSYGSFKKQVSITVNKAPLTITANNASREHGAANPTFTVSYSGFVNGETASALSGTLKLSTTANANSPAGSYPIVPSGLTSSNYTITFVNGTLTVTAKPATQWLTHLPFVAK